MGMKFEVKPLGKQYRFDQESDITDVIYGRTGLHVTVIAATSMFTNIYLEFHFDSVAGIRMLDELDMLGYWGAKAFDSGHHLYEITVGGWGTGEAKPEGVLREDQGYREWFIATTNHCMNILADKEPLIREITNSSISS